MAALHMLYMERRRFLKYEGSEGEVGVREVAIYYFWRAYFKIFYYIAFTIRYELVFGEI